MVTPPLGDPDGDLEQGESDWYIVGWAGSSRLCHAASQRPSLCPTRRASQRAPPRFHDRKLACRVAGGSQDDLLEQRPEEPVRGWVSLDTTQTTNKRGRHEKGADSPPNHIDSPFDIGMSSHICCRSVCPVAEAIRAKRSKNRRRWGSGTMWSCRVEFKSGVGWFGDDARR